MGVIVEITRQQAGYSLLISHSYSQGFCTELFIDNKKASVIKSDKFSSIIPAFPAFESSLHIGFWEFPL